MIRRSRLAVALCCAAAMVTGCTGRDLGPPTSSPTASSAGSVPSSSRASGSESSASLTPVTDPGLVTGPGVDDASVSLGLLVDDDRDQGFTAGVRLWARAFNRSGGVCGRTVQLLSPAVDERGADAYRSLADSSFGLIALPSADFRAELATMVAADRLPTDTPEGTISDLTTVGGPVVLGATDDVLAINTAAHWVTDGTLQPGSRLAVLTGTADADGADQDVLSALQWWSTGSGVDVVSTTPDDPLPDDVSAIYAVGDPTELRTLVERLAGERGLAPVVRTGLPTTTPSPSTSGASSSVSPPATTATDSSAPPSTSAAPSSPMNTDDPVAVATDLDGARALADLPAAVGSVTVASVTPAFTAAHPIGTALAQAFVDMDLAPGPRSFEGYAAGEAWGRVLQPLCTARMLTRSAATAQWATLAPAAADSIIGPTQPANQLDGGLPNSRVSALSVLDPTALTGLAPLTLLDSAPNIAEYRTTG